MSDALLSQIETFLAQQHIGEHRFGMLAVRNGRLVERLRRGGRVWPETEQCVLAFIAEFSLSPANRDAADHVPLNDALQREANN